MSNTNGNTHHRPTPDDDPAWQLPAWRHPITHPELRMAVIQLVTGLVCSPAFDTLVADVDPDKATAAAHALLAALFPARPIAEG